MAWIHIWTLCIALSTASADIFHYPSHPPQHQNAEPWSYQETYDRSLYHETKHRIPGINNKNYRDTSFKYQEPRKGSIRRLWSPERPIRRPIPFEYNDRSDQNNVRDIPIFREFRLQGNFTYKIFNELPNTYPSETKRRATVDSDDLQLFREMKPEGRNMFIPQVPEDCLESGICENSPDYPHEYVDMILAKISDANIRFNLDVIETPEIVLDNEIEHRVNQTKTLCKPAYQMIYPDKVRTTTGNWVFVINGRENKVQGFAGTICAANEEPCQNFPSVPEDYHPICVQKKIGRPMWALDHNGGIVLVTTPVPSCCVCEIVVVAKSVTAKEDIRDY